LSYTRIVGRNVPTPSAYNIYVPRQKSSPYPDMPDTVGVVARKALTATYDIMNMAPLTIKPWSRSQRRAVTDDTAKDVVDAP
jgi:hypothetical protein